MTKPTIPTSAVAYTRTLNLVRRMLEIGAEDFAAACGLSLERLFELEMCIKPATYDEVHTIGRIIYAADHARRSAMRQVEAANQATTEGIVWHHEHGRMN